MVSMGPDRLFNGIPVLLCWFLGSYDNITTKPTKYILLPQALLNSLDSSKRVLRKTP